ncbi:hypothetical protein CDAR_428451 [Caerostris darwini]|uniref:Uncharacterized protein n=1 Tax=Caerostris darwini TaxID=1538125 RepID=A0AAV4T8F6_9ARAC|nr:hypothetical protein CDAR_428451 [Caerostris darwini]
MSIEWVVRITYKSTKRSAIVVGKEKGKHQSDISDASCEVLLLEECIYDFTQLGEVQFYMYFPTKLSCQTYHNSTLEHEHKKSHPDKRMPAAAVRTSSSPSTGMISTTLIIQKRSVLLRSTCCEKYDSILQMMT